MKRLTLAVEGEDPKIATAIVIYRLTMNSQVAMVHFRSQTIVASCRSVTIYSYAINAEVVS